MRSFAELCVQNRLLIYVQYCPADNMGYGKVVRLPPLAAMQLGMFEKNAPHLVLQHHLKGPGHITVKKRFVQDSLRVRGILFTNCCVLQMADHET